MSFNLIALAVCLFMVIHGFIAFRAGLKKEDKKYFFTVKGSNNTKPFVENLFWGAIEFVAAICGLFIYVPLIFFK